MGLVDLEYQKQRQLLLVDVLDLWVGGGFSFDRRQC